MRHPLPCLVVTLLLALAARPAAAADDADPLAGWRAGVTVKPVSTAAGRHTTHSYYLHNPESPDGSRVLFFASTAANGESGDVVVLDRATGKETVVARNVTCEDAHRVACQQWTLGGKAVAFHDVRDGHWGVYLVDLATGKERQLAADRQVGFGQGAGHLVPVYGPHWKPGAHRGLELADAATGEVHEAMKVETLEEAYKPWLAKQFAGRAVSVFFPIVSPDESKVFFKVAAGSGGDDFRSKNTSVRQGLVAYDLTASKLLFMREQWGHPAWFPDSRRIIEVGNLVFDAADKGKASKIEGVPVLPGGPHLAVSPDGKTFVTDGLTEKLGGKPGEWGIMVGDTRGGEANYVVLHRFDNSKGAKTWRHNHPHPVFSADGRRIYFNVNDGEFTRLFVAERGGGDDAAPKAEAK